MRTLVRNAGPCIFALLLSFPLLAQDRGGRQQGGGAPAAGSTAGRSSVVSTAPANSNTGVSRTAVQGSNAYSAAAAPVSGSVSYTPDLRRTSFTSSQSYYDSLNFFYWVHNRFYLDQYYFSRFYRNTEPLITPQLARLTMSQPLSFSSRLLASIDQLEAMMSDQQAGKQVNKADMAAKTEEIRDLAKQIRQDQSIVYFDQRKEKDLLRGTQYAELGPEAIAQMREMALDLNRQIRNLYDQKSTTTVSVESLAAPSFSSLSKGIERLSKVVSQPARKGS
jgi:hypothetical protein